MEKRPKIQLKLTTADKFLEWLSWLLIITVWVLIISNYKNLPDTIPIHYNGAGQVDRLGDRATILALPIIATVLFIGLSILNKFPHHFNYLTT